MAGRSDVVVLGGVNTDYLVRTAQLPRPDTPMTGGQFVRACGGKGLNQAVAIARLGGQTAFVACTGADSRGDEALAQLRAERVDAQFVCRHHREATGVVLVQVDDKGRKQTSAALGANQLMTVDTVDAASQAIAQARMLLVQLEVPVECVARAVRLAREHRVQVILDPAPAQPLPDSLIRDIDVLKPNAGEARALTGVDVRDQPSALEAARGLHERGARHVIVSLDTATLLLTAGAARWYPNLPVRTIDTTGAGDAFAGALAIALLEGLAISEAVAFAQAGAALATTIVGALPSLPRREAVQRLFETSTVRP
jgi:ribokinase